MFTHKLTTVKKNERYKSIPLVIISVIATTLFIYYLNKFSSFLSSYGVENLFSQKSHIAKLIYFSICFLQPIILPLPEPVTLIAGSAVFGPTLGAFIGFSGTILGIITTFFLGRFVGDKLINKLVDESKLLKFNNYIEKSETLMLLGLFILPILPDEIICIGAGLARINPYKFVIIATVSKLITSICLSFSISIF